VSVLRRFWTSAAIVPHAEGWAVALDGKTALTPARAALATRHKRLATAVAAEWAAVGESVDPRAMPMTGFLNATIDRVGPQHTALAMDVAKFAGMDLVCYRAEGPEALVQRQAAGWDPVLEWIGRRYDVRLASATGVTPVAQPAEGLARLNAAVAALDSYRLTAGIKLSGIYKSLALTLCVLEGERDAVQAYGLSRIDETFQAERWGEDAEAARRAAREREEAGDVAMFLALLD
jgi:chaperone required for assembly of F1-ATPase